ncbi:uncharacterized protein K441DRAFT_238623 [Cenococcum geophilum 1.58]|uniref:uncharacterized protein n=1 Tax=Cenococcum geophilum 1.58 TaxID=794803 RepID=UPI00358EC50C|nr:hypothetical protein K441DRAFT_238623 [Cenococcum geophilum 1.58]
MKCSQTQSGEPKRWTCRYLLTHDIGRFIRVPALTLFRWLQYMERKDMTIAWTACGGSTQWWSRDLLGTLYILGDGRSPLALRLQFPRSSASRDNERYLGRAHEDHRHQLLEPNEVSAASLQTRSAPKVAQRPASILDQVIHSNLGWDGVGARACLTCPAVPVSIKLHQLRVGPAAGGSLCNSDRPRAANTAGNKWPCKRFSKRFGRRDAGQRSSKPPKPRGA